MNKLKTKFNEVTAVCTAWLLNRESADQTTEKSFWTFFGMIAGLVVFGGLLVALVLFRDQIATFMSGVTSGNTTDAPGGWKK